MKINQIGCNKYTNTQKFCGRLAVNLADSPNDIELIDTKKIKYISKTPDDCFKTAINVTDKGNIVVDYKMSDVLQAYTAACQDPFVTIDISSKYNK